MTHTELLYDENEKHWGCVAGQYNLFVLDQEDPALWTVVVEDPETTQYTVLGLRRDSHLPTESQIIFDYIHIVDKGMK